MLTQAIVFVQDIQLGVLGLVFVCMYLQDRQNRTLRWIMCAYLSALAGGLVGRLSFGHLPSWIFWPAVNEAAPIGYACIHAAAVEFTQRWTRSRWVGPAMFVVSLPVYIWLSGQHGMGVWSNALVDGTLGVQTALTCCVLLTTRDHESRWPRWVMGVFLFAYSAVELLRVIVSLKTHHMPEDISHLLTTASGMVYVISGSALPLGFIWMLNTRLHAHLKRQSNVDPLTLLLNRRGLDAAGDAEFARYERDLKDFAVVVCDLDYFKRLNDTFGHTGGDEVLRQTALLFQQFLRQSDVLARVGGEEFVLILPWATLEGARELVERLQQTLERHEFLPLGPTSMTHARMTASFGITSTNGRSELSWSQLYQEADVALYAAKNSGRNRAEIFRPAQEHVGAGPS